MSDTRWGLVGFGEVGSTIAQQITEAGDGPVTVVDPLLIQIPPPPHVAERAAPLDLRVVNDVATLMRCCDTVLSVVTPRTAAWVAEEAAAAGTDTLFVDLNTTPPNEKRRLAGIFPSEAYVDGAILGSIAATRAGTPLAFSGPRAERLVRAVGALGFSASSVGPMVGGASALKICRSIFMKGVECLFVETLIAAAAFEVGEAVLTSVEETFTSLGFRGTANMLVTTHAVHCARRAAEMEGVASTLGAMGVPAMMAGAARDTLAETAESGLPESTAGTVPKDGGAVIDYLAKYYKENRS